LTLILPTKTLKKILIRNKELEYLQLVIKMSTKLPVLKLIASHFRCIYRHKSLLIPIFMNAQFVKIGFSNMYIQGALIRTDARISD